MTCAEDKTDFGDGGFMDKGSFGKFDVVGD
jgi:hypothetical protein